MISVHSFHPSPNTYHTHNKISITSSIHPTSQITRSHIVGFHMWSPPHISWLEGRLGGSKIFHKTSAAESTTLKNVGVRCQAPDDIKNSKKSTKNYSPSTIRFCSCIRRHFMEAVGTDLLPIHPPHASKSPPNDPMDMLNRIHPPRPDWYEEFYAYALDKFTKSYEAEIAGYKSQLFADLRGKAKHVLEIGIGTGPNLKYYANGSDVRVFGIDPIRKMEKYAQAAAEAAGIPSTNFKFMQAVAEALPVDDASIDAVIGTLVLCSVKDVDLTLQEIRRVLKPGGIYLFVEHVAAEDGTILKFVQSVLDPLQQTVADGCHLTRKTGNSIAKAGFSAVDIHKVFISTASLVNPHVYGIAHN